MSKSGYYLGMTPEQQDIVKMIRDLPSASSTRS